MADLDREQQGLEIMTLSSVITPEEAMRVFERLFGTEVGKEVIGAMPDRLVERAAMTRLLQEVEELRTSIGMSFQQCFPGVKEDSDFIRQVDSRLEHLDLVQDVDLDVVEQVIQLYESKLPAIAEIKRRFERHSDEEFDGREHRSADVIFNTRHAIDTLYALIIAGALDTSKPLQLHSICGGDGMEGFLAHLFRDGRETFATCHDKSARARRTHEILQKYAFCISRGARFEEGSVAQKIYYKREGARNVWLIQNPSMATGIMTEKLTKLSREEMPDAIAMVPCNCCSYESCYYPRDGEAEVTANEWERLGGMVERYNSLPPGNTPEQKNLVDATRVMDTVRASYINRQNPIMKAVVRVMPGMDEGQNLIHIEPRQVT